MIYYRILNEVRKWGRLRYLVERLSDGRVATVKPSWIKNYGLYDEEGPLYVGSSRTKGAPSGRAGVVQPRRRD